jgi:OmpA-OmpF porin, OOP family
MKKIIFGILIVFVQSVTIYAQPQLPNDSWSFNFGFGWPRFVNHSLLSATESNYGGYIGIQRNFSEHVGLRMQVNFISLEGVVIGDYITDIVATRVNSFAANFDIIYYLVPCEAVSPYLALGGGPIYYLLDMNRPNKTFDDNNLSYQFNVGAGADWILDENWKLRTEANYYTVMDNKFDGVDGPNNGGLLGGHYISYLSVNIGLNYAFSKGEPSNYCQLYSGITQEYKDMTDYNRIEEMIKKYIPKEITKEIVVEKPTAVALEKWVLVGVNFDFSSAKLTAESYPILYDAAKTLLKNPNMKVEIQGYTDNIGTPGYNKELSQKRADAVKNYLVSKGVSTSRLTVVGMAESNPIADNNTADGRAINRRIEFKVK